MINYYRSILSIIIVAILILAIYDNNNVRDNVIAGVVASGAIIAVNNIKYKLKGGDDDSEALEDKFFEDLAAQVPDNRRDDVIYMSHGYRSTVWKPGDIHISNLGIDTIPDSIANMKGLRELTIDGYGNNINSLPSGMTKLENLTHMEIKNISIPNIPRIESLKSLILSNVSNLKELPELENLTYLTLNNLPQLEELPEWLSKCKNLQYLDIRHLNNVILPKWMADLIVNSRIDIVLPPLPSINADFAKGNDGVPPLTQDILYNPYKIKDWLKQYYLPTTKSANKT